MLIAADTVATPERLLHPGWIEVVGATIRTVGEGAPPGIPDHDIGAGVLAPGFVDLHNHGGGGASFSDGAAEARVARETHLRHGTTTLLASLVTADLDSLARQCAELAPLVASGELAGIHLEGPWLAAGRSGAHDGALLRNPEVADIERLYAAADGSLRMVTLAPERPGTDAAVRHLAARGVIAALGHSDATYEQTRAALLAGASVGTHLYNAMRPLDHREPGIAGALMSDPGAVVEIIADGVHLHHAVVANTFAAKPYRTVLVSDAMAGAGATDGRYHLGRLDVDVRDGLARVAGTDTIAGSTLTLDQAVRYAVRDAGTDLHTVLRAATLTPADVLDLRARGRITPGAEADLVVLTSALDVRAVMHQGRWVRHP